MSMKQWLTTIRASEGVRELAPEAGGEFPEIAWGDHFFYYAPDGDIPNEQPYVTVVTKDYPDEPGSGLDPEGRYRINLNVGKTRFTELLGETPPGETDFTSADVVLPHPVHAAPGWIAVVNPGPRTTPVVQELLSRAHQDAKRRAERWGD